MPRSILWFNNNLEDAQERREAWSDVSQHFLTGYFKAMTVWRDWRTMTNSKVVLTSLDQSVHPFVHQSMAPFVDGANAKELEHTGFPNPLSA